MGFSVWGVGCGVAMPLTRPWDRVESLGLRVEGMGVRVSGSGFGVATSLARRQGLGIQGGGFRVHSMGVSAWGLG